MKQESISLWKKRIADKKASGLKLTEWCEQNQLTTHAYYYWNRKISDMNRNGQDDPLFVEIPTSASGSQNSAIDTLRIEWKELSIQVTDFHSASLAAEFLAKLQKLCTAVLPVMQNISYLAVGATDFRKQITGLAAIVHLQFGPDPFTANSVFLFCNKKKDSIKVLRYD